LYSCSATYRFLQRLCDGLIQVNDEDWPSFLYENGDFDPEAIDKGLFKGYFLVRVSPTYYFIFDTAHCRQLGMAPYLHSTHVGSQEDTWPCIGKKM
jgi:hypothetical protein